MSSVSQNLAEHVRQGQPQMFLPLAPTTSSSYPTAQSVKPTAQSDKPAAHGSRRTSSQSSVGSASSASSFRFLKLGPVHYGEHSGDHKEDYHEVAVDE
ncbi:uncharacterized protein GGS25DRAFT_441936 [Hypoxylon fragiforme]|uniref:uncharacterized protein n=1 Tax=Hypoxylon fragiforme TaxID=63214 RepID=UPI0020C5C833|nr:uncharacterized protein GGS25DRAFT_441936 [Hypoxylon fragiforme]KAI2603936.1 hypothetical protein GGS25DRAFT_441936 [Hypoxylon fragiforme]